MLYICSSVKGNFQVHIIRYRENPAIGTSYVLMYIYQRIYAPISLGKMMQTKLTLRLDQDLIRRAKDFAEANGKTVSQIVADYFALLEQPQEQDVETTPTVRSLRGVLRGHHVNEKDYRHYLEDRHP